MTVKVFAVLKDFFGESLEVTETTGNIEALRALLADKNPAATPVLNMCRFAVGDAFVDKHYQLKESDTVFVVPPSSGG